MTAGEDPAVPKQYRKRRLVVVTAVVTVGILVALWLLQSCRQPEVDTVRVVAAGDMVCDPKDPAMGGGVDCKSQEVSDIAVSLQPDAFFGLGDYVYEIPKSDTYQELYDPSWGRLKDITVPAKGNQEYKVHEANTFHTYFGQRSGPELGYWSTDFGRWHIVVLNSNCTVVVGGCAEGSPMQKWLAEDLAENDAQCTVALMHHPRWSTGVAGPDGRLDDLFGTLVDNNVEILLSGHEAHYERFGTLDQDGKPSESGTRQFVVGTGGQVVYEPGEGDAAWRNKGNLVASEFRDFTQHGVLELTLQPATYEWAFHSLDAGVIDSGQGVCR